MRALSSVRKCPQRFGAPWFRLGKTAFRLSIPEYVRGWIIGLVSGGHNKSSRISTPVSSNCFQPARPAGHASSFRRNDSGVVMSAAPRAAARKVLVYQVRILCDELLQFHAINDPDACRCPAGGVFQVFLRN